MITDTLVKVELYKYRISQNFAGHVWHVSIAIESYEGEFSYGRDGLSIIHLTDKGISEKPDEKVSVGCTDKTPEDISEFIKSMKNEFTTKNYSVLNNNCVHFAQRFLKFLNNISIPEDIQKGHDNIAVASTTLIGVAARILIGCSWLASGAIGVVGTAGLAVIAARSAFTKFSSSSSQNKNSSGRMSSQEPSGSFKKPF